MFDWPDFFSTGSRHSNEVFMFFESYNFLKIKKQKCQKTGFLCGHLGFLAGLLDWKWELFNPVLFVPCIIFDTCLMLSIKCTCPYGKLSFECQNCQKLALSSKKLPKMVILSKKLSSFWHFFWHSKGNFREGQLYTMYLYDKWIMVI